MEDEATQGKKKTIKLKESEDTTILNGKKKENRSMPPHTSL